MNEAAASRRAFLGAASAGLFLGAAGCGGRGGEEVVLYCAADRLHAEPILREFESRTGVHVRAKFDTEATKSLSLVGSLIREADAPVCDLFWNNERGGTEDLAARGLLAPHRGEAWEATPPQHRDPEGLWCGFGGRLRVWIVNTDRLPATREAVEAELAKEADLSFAYANPRYGTTLTHFSLLHRELGDDGLRAFAERLDDAGAVTASGNAAVKDLVAAGTVACGWTDTDDAYLAIEAGAPVETLPVEVPGPPGPAPICIPNTVALTRGGPNAAHAARLADYLLGKEVAVRLANGPSRQIPLTPVSGPLPEDVKQFAGLARDAVPLAGLAPHRDAVLAWLSGEETAGASASGDAA
ncbi:extracellular solute-binding protein [Alienimonas californiensis]|uniref:Iron deficiency-induced protein A n=1 Tax=Alienimonas californiensis TaxID=2527989 RepID=A0A517PC21_9PLAN|nr:extracellular solute-binding protein [Alienimonas californiensis]QDT16918.1 Iron deficiency-induced protein A precursor [Alienimonas californiensis]